MARWIGSTAVASVALFVAGLGTVQADGQSYPAAAVSPFRFPAPTVEFVTYPAGHFVAAQTPVSVHDEVFAAINSFFCQDLNADTVCGGPGEPHVHFCASTVLVAGVTYRPEADGWFFGDLLEQSCPTPSVWTAGHVEHG